MKKTQKVMVWFLPLIVIGGLYNPWLGYLVVAMMVFFLIMSVFMARFWCWNLCPRGAFLDIVISKLSQNKPLPRVFASNKFRWLVFIFFICFVAWRIIRTGGDPLMIGFVFVSMCLITTIVSVILGMSAKHRGWCAICPMGFLQEKISKIKRL